MELREGQHWAGGRLAHLKSLLTKMEIESQRKRGEEKERREGVMGWELMEGEGRKGGELIEGGDRREGGRPDNLPSSVTCHGGGYESTVSWERTEKKGGEEE